jgi:hypothetical protein
MLIKPLEKILIDWKLDFGVEKESQQYPGRKYRAIPDEDRKECLEELVRRLVNEYGVQDESYFYLDSTQCKIAQACMPPKHRTSKRRANHTEAVITDLLEAARIVFREREQGLKFIAPNADAQLSNEEMEASLEARSKKLEEQTPEGPEEDEQEEEVSEEEKEDQGLSAHQLRLIEKSQQAPAAADDTVAPTVDPNSEVFGYLGIDPKDFGYTNE